MKAKVRRARGSRTPKSGAASQQTPKPRRRWPAPTSGGEDDVAEMLERGIAEDVVEDQAGEEQVDHDPHDARVGLFGEPADPPDGEAREDDEEDRSDRGEQRG